MIRMPINELFIELRKFSSDAFKASSTRLRRVILLSRTPGLISLDFPEDFNLDLSGVFISSSLKGARDLNYSLFQIYVINFTRSATLSVKDIIDDLGVIKQVEPFISPFRNRYHQC